jgi:hypothetical protein
MGSLGGVKGSGATDAVFDIQRDIMMPRDYCLVSVSKDSTTFEMH